MSDDPKGRDLAEWARSLDARAAELRDEEAEFDQAVRVRAAKEETAYRQAHPEQRPTTEPAVARYRRSDASKFPTSLLGQRAAVEGMAAAEGWTMTGPGTTRAVREHNRRIRGRMAIDQPHADVMRAKLLDLLAEHEAATARHRVEFEETAGLQDVIDRYNMAESHQERDDIAEQAGGSLRLTTAGFIRRMSKALEASLPGVIVDAHVDGMSAKQIARELSCSDRHAYQVIKDYPWEAAWILYRATGDDEWEQVDAGLIETTETADDLANQLIGQRLTDDLARTGARVSVWRAGDGNDPDEARGECVVEGDTRFDH
ncbi:hypothetical protein [Streptomyces vinaceus]|uniref:hypothetical protein n=1 Tax=Streptomyces vinaceus TaxID=1960 RepID=UPI0038123C3F